MKTNIFKKLLLRQEIVSLGHVLFPCLLSALLPMVIRNSDYLFQFFSKMNTDTIGIHTFIFYILVWFRGGSNPSAKHDLSKKDSQLGFADQRYFVDSSCFIYKKWPDGFDCHS